jgi:hypothetical protein
MINGYWLATAICTAARLGVADHVRDTPTATEDLAAATHADSRALYRLLRALAGVGIFAEGSEGSFVHTPLSSALRSNVPGSMHGLALMTGILHLHAWPELAHSVRTGETAFRKVFGSEIFEYVKSDSDAGAAFDAAMASYTAVSSGAVAAAYDFSSVGTLVDVGGGTGALVAAIVKKQPTLKAIVFDMPTVVERARAYLSTQGLEARVEVVGGSFFESVIAGGDTYTLKSVLHDWDDAQSIAILSNIRKVIPMHGRVLVIQSLIEEGNGAGAAGKLLDLNMLAMTGGRERTATELGALLDAAGFRSSRIIPAGPNISILEARPV